MLLLSLLLCASCNSSVQLAGQQPTIKPRTPTYQRVGVYFPPAVIPNRLLTSIDGDPFRIGKLEIIVEDAARSTIMNALQASSKVVIVFPKKIGFSEMKRHDLDAFFWPQHLTARSSLEREGTLFPSYSSYAGVSLRLMRMSGFRGTIDSLQLTGSGSYFAHRTGISRAGIARTSAEIAFRDLANKIVRALNQLTE